MKPVVSSARLATLRNARTARIAAMRLSSGAADWNHKKTSSCVETALNRGPLSEAKLCPFGGVSSGSNAASNSGLKAITT